MHISASFFTTRNIKILKCTVSEFEPNFSEGKADSIFPLHHVLFPFLLPSLSPVKKIIQGYLTKCEEPDFLHLGTSQFEIETSPDLTSI